MMFILYALLVVVGVMAATVILLALKLRKRRKPKTPPNDRKASWMPDWYREVSRKTDWQSWATLLIGLLLIHLIVWWGWPEGHAMMRGFRVFWPAHLALIFLAVISGSKHPVIKTVSVLVLVALIASLLAETGNPFKSTSPAGWGSSRQTRTATSTLTAEHILPVIAECESGGRQFDSKGNLVKNPDSSAIGMYGIMASLHEEDAKKLGHDIRTEEGNKAYATILLQKYGTNPWKASRGCWGAKLVALGGVYLPTTDIDGPHTTKPSMPARAIVPRGWAWEAWYDETEVSEEVLTRGTDKILVYSTKPSVEEAKVRIRVYQMS